MKKHIKTWKKAPQEMTRIIIYSIKQTNVICFITIIMKNSYSTNLIQIIEIEKIVFIWFFPLAGNQPTDSNKIITVRFMAMIWCEHS